MISYNLKGENMDYINKLCVIYDKWCEKQKLLPNEFGAEFESDSADSLLAWGDITEKQRKWLERFVRVWDKAEAKN